MTEPWLRALRFRGTPLAIFGCAWTLLTAPALADDTPSSNVKSERASASKSASGSAAAGPRRGSGLRRIVPTVESEKTKPQSVGDSRSGRGPAKVGKSRLPPSRSEKYPAKAPDAKIRRVIAGGEPRDTAQEGLPDPELLSLREAERILFPEPLAGLSSGWSWEEPQPPKGGVELLDSGVPPSVSSRAPEPKRDLTQDEARWVENLAMPNFSVRVTARVVKYLKFYRDNPRGQRIIRIWTKRSGLYAPAMKEQLARAGLPTDLVWLSLIESGHNPTIFSPAGAAGLWQFIPSSGKMYGLNVNRWVDERLDPELSTQAAARFLGDLYQRFGTWELAMAAYNMGYGGISRAIRKFNTNDFWELSRYEGSIPWETTLYVPKIFAMAIVMKNRDKFGVGDIVPDPAVRFDTIQVEAAAELKTIAERAGLVAATLRDLNRQYVADRTPPVDAAPSKGKATWSVRVPVNSGALATERLHDFKPNSQYRTYRVRFGDTISAIAGDVGVAKSKLSALNKIGARERLREGTILLVPRKAPERSGSERTVGEVEPNVAVVPATPFSKQEGQRVFYKVRNGDELGQIANAFLVAAADVRRWNALDADALMVPGMVVQVYVSDAKKLESVRHTLERDTKVLIAGSPEFYSYYESLNGRNRVIVVAREGDTLRSVGRKYGLSTGSMERINRRSRHTKLIEGEHLVVYSKRPVPAQSIDGEPEPLPKVLPPRPDRLPKAPENRQLKGKSQPDSG